MRFASLIGPAGRRIPWPVLLVTFGIGSAVTAWRLSSGDDPLVYVRMVAVLMAAAAATCVEDSAESLAVTTPAGRLRRRAWSVGSTGAVTVVMWVLFLAVAAVTSTVDIPTVAVSAQMTTLVAYGWFVAAALAGSGRQELAAAGVMVSAIFSLAHPKFVGWLWVDPRDAVAWHDAQRRWLTIGLASVIGFVWLGRDVASRTRRRWA